MKKEFNFKKGDECYEVSNVIDDEVSEMLNKEFEDVNAELKSDIKITILIDDALSKEDEE